MRLEIKNLAKISQASIDLNGITVIAGANDSGKSTCGKALCSVFMAFVQLEGRRQRLLQERINDIAEQCLHDRLFLPGEEFVQQFLDGHIDSKETAEKIMVEARFTSRRTKNERLFDDKTVAELADRLDEIRNLDAHTVECEAVRRCFAASFGNQYTPLFSGVRGATTVSFSSDEGARISISLKKDSCEFKSGFEFRGNAWLIADPAIVGMFGERYARFRDMFEYALVDAVGRSLRQEALDPVSGAIDASLQKEKYAKIAACLDVAGVGDVFWDKSKGYVIQRKGLSGPLKLANASMGVKAVALLQILVESGLLHAGDFLVLDEPEIHLHPDWQLIYAEAVVLLYQVLGVRVLITTHSPDFIQALYLFARKYNVEKVLSAYLTEGSRQSKIVKVAAEDWDAVFDRFASTMEKLRKMEDVLINKVEESEE